MCRLKDKEHKEREFEEYLKRKKEERYKNRLYDTLDIVIKKQNWKIFVLEKIVFPWYWTTTYSLKKVLNDR